MPLFQMHGMTETRERRAFITDLLVERSKGALILNSDSRLSRRAAPFGFAVGRDGLLEFSLHGATRGEQAYK